MFFQLIDIGNLGFPGNKLLSFLNAKAASQLNFDDFANVEQALVMHNSLNILLAHQSWAETSFSGAHLQNLSGERTCVASSQVVLMSEYSEGIPELKLQSENMRFAGKYWRKGVIGHSWKKI